MTGSILRQSKVIQTSYSVFIVLRTGYYDEEIIQDFGAVTDRINSKFDTCFSCFIHSEENCEEVFRRIEKWNAHVNGTYIPHPDDVLSDNYPQNYI